MAIRVGSRLRVADNSGAKEVLCIRVLGSRKDRGQVGNVIVVTIKRALPDGKVKAGTVHRALIVRTKQPLRSRDSMVSYADNAVVIINKQGELIGTRVFGPVDNRLRSKGFIRIISLAQEVVQ